MAEITLNITMDKDLKNEFDIQCFKLGINPSDAFNMFAIKTVMDEKIPFEISDYLDEENMSSLINKIIDQRKQIMERGISVFYSLRKQAKNNGLTNMSLDEINKEIEEAKKISKLSLN